MPEVQNPTETPDTDTVDTENPEVSQDDIMDMIVAGESPSQISDKIKDMLYAKSASKVDSFRPEVAANTFNEPEVDEALATAAAEISGQAAAERAAPAEE